MPRRRHDPYGQPPRRRRGIFRDPAKGAAQEVASPFVEAALWGLLRLVWLPFKLFFRALGRVLEAVF